MYQTILVPLEATATDEAVITHILKLAAVLHSRVVLLHVATGVPAQFHGPDAEGEEVTEDRAYLQKVCERFADAGITADAELAFGHPTTEIVQWINTHTCDLVAMSTHGHKWLADLFLGTTASPVQHSVNVPVLLLRAK
jgi:nucleotide-binding universal stress UspA family protein